MNFEDNLKRFISIDNEIKGLNERIKLLRDNRTELSDNLIDYAIKNNISNKDIRINNEKIKFTSSKIQQPLTFKYLEKSLNEIIMDKNKVGNIVDYIKNKRETKIVNEIKRLSNNNI